MAKTPIAKRDEHHELTRRALIKWSVAAGAALGVSRSKVFEILERTAGKETAFAASENPTTRSVHMIFGNGGLAGPRTTLFFTAGPHRWYGSSELQVHGLLGSIEPA